MADKTTPEYLEDYINGLAKSLGTSDPDANRLVSRTSAEGDNDTFSSVNEMMLSAKKVLELADIMDARANKRSFFRPIKVTRN